MKLINKQKICHSKNYSVTTIQAENTSSDPEFDQCLWKCLESTVYANESEAH